MAKKVRVEEAIGKKLAHDIVCYAPGLKSTSFKRGHVVTSEDIDRLKDTGDYYVLVEDGAEKVVHEEDAATRMAIASIDDSVFYSKSHQGKVNFLAKIPGLLKVKSDTVKRVNLIDDFVIATKSNNTWVKRGELLGSVKIVPLAVDEHRMEKVEKILKANKPIIRILPLKVKKIALVITGTEVYEGRIKDSFYPTLSAKFAEYNLKIGEKVIVPDDSEKIKEKIMSYKKKGHDFIIVASGMAVDAGDVTPRAIRKTGAEVVSRGVPVFPGSMLMVAYLADTPVLGLPACVITDKITSFDLLLPRVLAGDRITRKEIADMGHGGML
ncbi:MAG: molybdopterin-binding protein [Candidatus Hadarchaeaceae archaeon]